VSNPYDDPRLQDDDRLSFDNVGDRAKGKIIDIKVVNAVNGAVLTLTLANISQRTNAGTRTIDKADLMAGSKNLRATLKNLQPQIGDTIDVELIELRPTGQPSPAKIFRVEVQGHLPTDPTPDDIFAR
jgi:hypothetical protein